MADATTDLLKTHLRQLRLPTMGREFEKLARDAAKNFDVWIGGSVGPLGVRIEPLGKVSLQEARDAFREQIAALVEGGVDLLMLETFGYLGEIHQAILAAVRPSVPRPANQTDSASVRQPD